MELTGIPTPHMDWESSNLPDAWKKFKQHVELIFKGPLSERGEVVKVQYLLLWIGDKGRDIYNTWTDLSDADAKKLEPYYTRFQNYVQPKLNPIFGRYKFNNEIQGTNSFELFVTRLKTLAKDCSFGTCCNDQLIRDRIVFGVTSAKVREKLINEGDKLTLDKAIEIAQNYEYAQEQLKSMQAQANTDVHAVRRAGPPKKKRISAHGDKTSKANEPKAANSGGGAQSQSQRKKCDNCGYDQHARREQCPAKNKRCNYCQKWNHFSSVCRAKNVHDVQCEPAVEDQRSQSDNDSDFFVDSVDKNSPGESRDQAFVTIDVGQSQNSIQFKLDTGAQVNIIPSPIFNKLGISGNLTKPKNKLTAYNGTNLKTHGICTLPCAYGSQTCDIEFYIVETTSPPILGLKTCLSLGLIKLVYAVTSLTPEISVKQEPPMTKAKVLSEYKDVFQGIGNLPGECKIHIEPDAVPVIHPPRRVPIALRDKLKDELVRMEKCDVITKVTEPTEWVNSLVVVEKQSGKLRVCLDPRDLNNAIQRPHYPMRTLEDVLPELSGAAYFTKLDARSGYWGIKLESESSYLTTFNTPFGRYRFKRLPFGLVSSQDEFIRKIDECYEGLEGMTALVDDILVFGRTRAEHDTNLRNVLERSREKDVKLNNDKLEVGMTQVKYFGHLLTNEGLKPDPEKVEAIRRMESPENKGELETFLGMVNYLAKFAPNLAEITTPMRNLLTNNVEFSWDQPQADAFQKVKDLITQTPGPILAFFDPKKEVTLQTDASKFGLGASILQSGKPIAFASKSLTTSEVNYAQIEKEMYAILFGCRRFHQYLYGRKVRAETDHKPLISIMKKPLSAAPPRLQRMMLQLQRYDLEVTFKAGKDIPVADLLSRKFLPDTHPELSEGMDAYVHGIMSHIPVSDSKLQEIQTEIESDMQMKILKRTILDGWPANRGQCPPKITDFWNHRDQLSVTNDLILMGQRLIIPKSMRSKFLDSVHVGHMGVEKCLHRARQVMFWPKMSLDITNMVLNCDTCLEMRNSNPKEPMVPHEVPHYPWQTVGTDLFTWNGSDFIVVVDYYSRYFEVSQLRNTRSSSIINKLKSIFSRHGIPERCFSDNGPQYVSQEMKEFAHNWGFTHVTSSPYHPKSNGLAEKTVQTIKRIFQKAKADGKDPYLGILEYRATPLAQGKSPAQLLMSRNLRSILPTVPEQLKPKVVNVKTARANMTASKMQAKMYHDVHSQPLKPLDIGDSVRIQLGSIWKPAIVVDKLDYRSYSVRTPDGGIYRRNRRHLFPTRKLPDTDSDPLQLEVPDSQSDTVQNHTPQEELGSESNTNDNSLPAEASPTGDSPYVTRSGRVVKPRTIPSM